MFDIGVKKGGDRGNSSGKIVCDSCILNKVFSRANLHCTKDSCRNRSIGSLEPESLSIDPMAKDKSSPSSTIPPPSAI